MTKHKFKAWRLRQCLTQEAAAKMLGMGRRQIVKYENGRARIPRVVELATKGVDANSLPPHFDVKKVCGTIPARLDGKSIELFEGWAELEFRARDPKTQRLVESIARRIGANIKRRANVSVDGAGLDLDSYRAALSRAAEAVRKPVLPLYKKLAAT